MALPAPVMVPIGSIKPNPENPRTIRDERFQKLVQSITDFPAMLALRPIVVNADGVVLGGNMRLRACQTAKLREVPVVYAHDLTPAQQREFIIKDNVGFGDWDWDTLANEWADEPLTDWALEVPVVDGHTSESADARPQLDNVIYKVVVECAGQHQQAALVEELEQRGFA